MAFDLSTARPVEEQKTGGFDLSTAMPVDEAAPNHPPAQGDSFGANTMDVLGELAASANRSVTEFVDFIGPDTANAILRLAGSKKQMPTLTGALAGTGIQGGFMEPGMARDAVQGAGPALTAAGGLKTVARSGAKLGNAALDMLGFGSSEAPAAAAAAKVYTALEDVTPKFEPATGRGLVKAQRKGALLGETGDTVAAGYRLTETGDVVKDGAQKGAMKQGFDPGLVAMIKASPPKAREKMAAMVDVVEQGKKNFRYSAENRPLDIAGDSVLSRVKVVREANRAAGNRLDHTAKALKGQRVDVAPAVDSFLGELEDMGVKFSPADGKVTFQGSDLEGVPGPQRVVKTVLGRMLNTKAPDAYDVHRMKRFIDEQVTYGKNARGLGGKTERILKGLRHNLDGLLDEQFPEYNRVNTDYSETIGALDSLQDVAGKKMDFYGPNADKAIGTLTRRLLSNAQSRVPLTDAINQLDSVAKKFTTKGGTDIVPHGYVSKRSGISAADLDDDIMGQVMFVDELEKIFGASARTSLQGDVEKAARQAANADGKGMIVDALISGANKARGINEENALKAIRELLKEPK